MIPYDAFWVSITYWKSWLAHRSLNSNSSWGSLEKQRGNSIHIHCSKDMIATVHSCHQRMHPPGKQLKQFVLYILVMQGDDMILGLLILTASPLSPLLPFWPGPPVSPCGDKCTHVNIHTHTDRHAIKSKTNKHFRAVLYLMVAVWCHYLVSILSWRPRRSGNPWQPYRSQFPVIPSWTHRPLLSLEITWESRAYLANRTVLGIMYLLSSLINVSYQEGNSHPRNWAWSHSFSPFLSLFPLPLSCSVSLNDTFQSVSTCSLLPTDGTVYVFVDIVA